MNARKAFSRAGWSFAVFEAASVLTELAVMLIGAMAARVFGWQAEYWELFLFLDISRYMVSIPAYYLMIERLPAQPPEKVSWPFSKLALGFLMIYGLTEAGGIIGNVLMAVLNGALPVEAENAVAELVSSLPLPALLFSVVILAPAVEELVFRKWLLDRIGRYGEKTAALVSGLIFGLAHGNFYQFFYAFAVGAAFAYIYLRTGKIRYTIGYHMVLNFLGSVPVVWMEKTADIGGMILSAAVILGLSAAGITLMIAYRKKLIWKTAEAELPFRGRFSAVAGNSGMLILLLVFAALFVWNMV